MCEGWWLSSGAVRWRHVSKPSPLVLSCHPELVVELVETLSKGCRRECSLTSSRHSLALPATTVPEAERVGGQVCAVRHIVPTLPGTARQGKCAPYATSSRCSFGSAVCSFGSAVCPSGERHGIFETGLILQRKVGVCTGVPSTNKTTNSRIGTPSFVYSRETCPEPVEGFVDGLRGFQIPVQTLRCNTNIF